MEPTNIVIIMMIFSEMGLDGKVVFNSVGFEDATWFIGILQAWEYDINSKAKIQVQISIKKYKI